MREYLGRAENICFKMTEDANTNIFLHLPLVEFVS